LPALALTDAVGVSLMQATQIFPFTVTKSKGCQSEQAMRGAAAITDATSNNNL
jgi:hypothetical protein